MSLWTILFLWTCRKTTNKDGKIVSKVSSYDVVPNALAIFRSSCLARVDSLMSNLIKSCIVGAGTGVSIIVSSPDGSCWISPTNPNTIHSLPSFSLSFLVVDVPRKSGNCGWGSNFVKQCCSTLQ